MDASPPPELVTETEPRPPRRRGRTTAIIAAAALLGIVAGTATGYTIQADRAPTTLPMLAQAGLAYPAPLPRGTKPTPLPAEEDSQVKTDGDLRGLLLRKPADAQESAEDYIVDGWSPLALYAAGWDSPTFAFSNLARLGFRRMASTSWDQKGDHETRIDLLQFRPGRDLGASEIAQGQREYCEEVTGRTGDAIGHSGNGRYWVFDIRHKPGYVPYQARAVAQRGDVMVDINIFDSEPITAKEIRTLAERQLERL